MAANYSFKRFIKKNYFEYIRNDVSYNVENYFHRLNIRSFKVKEIDRVDLCDIELISVTVLDDLSNTVKFIVDVKTKIEIYGTAHRRSESESKYKWFSVGCEVKLDKGFKDFRIREVLEYHKLKPQKKLSDSLEPYVHQNKLDTHAQEILKLVYPEALHIPTKIDVRLFADRLGLKIKDACLSRDHSIFGQMVFHDCKVELYESEKGSSGSFDVEGGTILVDPDIKYLRAIGSWNNTVIHECVHWLKHRKIFELAKMYGSESSHIRCQVTDQDEKKQDALSRMEWQANSLAPRILMPYKSFKQKAQEVIERHNQDGQYNITPDIIYELAAFFGVSAQSAKIRLIEIGCKGTIGVLEYVDNRYVKKYAFENDSIENNQTFSISINDALKQYVSNSDFRQTLNSGNFVYIDSHYCINDPKYITLNNQGNLAMTEYAYGHMDECCLIFIRSSRSNINADHENYSPWVLYSSVASKPITEHVYDSFNHSTVINLQSLSHEAKEIARMRARLPGSFGMSLTMLMEWRNDMTKEQLSDKSLVDVKMIQRMRNDNDRDWNIRTVAALCIGLQLPPIISYSLIEKAGLNFKTNEEDSLISLVLSASYKSGIHEANKLMIGAGYQPLS